MRSLLGSLAAYCRCIPQSVEPSGPQACHHIRGSARTHHWAPPPAAGGVVAAKKGPGRRKCGGSCKEMVLAWSVAKSQQWKGGGSTCACVHARGTRAGGPWSDGARWLTATGLKWLTHTYCGLIHCLDNSSKATLPQRFLRFHTRVKGSLPSII